MVAFIRIYAHHLIKHWKSKLVFIASISFIFWGLVVHVDLPVATNIRALQSTPLDTINLLISFLFHTNITLLLFTSLFFIAQSRQNQALEQASAQALAYLLLTMLAGMMIKLILLRARPYIRLCPHDFFLWRHFYWLRYNDWFSTPSGHVISAISSYFFWPRKQLFWWLLLILLVSFFRIYPLILHWAPPFVKIK